MIIFSTDSLMNSHPWNYDKYRMINQGYIWGMYLWSFHREEKGENWYKNIHYKENIFVYWSYWYQGMFPV